MNSIDKEKDEAMEASLNMLDSWESDNAQPEGLPHSLNSNNAANNHINNANYVSDEDIAAINAFGSNMYTLRSFKGYLQYLQGKPKKVEQAQQVLNIIKDFVNEAALSADEAESLGLMEAQLVQEVSPLLIKFGILKCRKTKAASASELKVNPYLQRNIQMVLKESISPKEVFTKLEHLFEYDRTNMVNALQSVEALKGTGVLSGVTQYLEEFYTLVQSVGLDAMYPNKLNNVQDSLAQLSAEVFSADEFDW